MWTAPNINRSESDYALHSFCRLNPFWFCHNNKRFVPLLALIKEQKSAFVEKMEAGLIFFACAATD